MNAPPDWTELTRQIAAAESRGMELGVAVRAPGGASFSHRGERRFRAASTIKIAIMIAVFRRIEAGLARADDEVVLTAADKVAGSGVLGHLHDGLRLTLADLLYLMMSISDNTATNMLIDRVGMAAVGALLRELGLAGSALQRPMMGAASAPGHENWAVPDEMAALVLTLFDLRAASAASCARMIALLERQQNDRRIARFLPRADPPRWGSKTGSLEGVCNDVGFVMTPAGPLVIAAFIEAARDPLDAECVIGEIARAALRAAG